MPQVMVFSELFKLYTDLRKSYVSPATIARTFVPTRQLVLRTLGDRPATDYTSIDLLQMIQRALETRKPGGVNANLRVLKGLGRWAAKQRLLGRENPFAELQVLKVPRVPVRYLTHEEFRQVYQAEKSTTLRNIYLTCLLTGQRAGDVLRLTWEQVDINHVVLRMQNRKTNRSNTVPIHPALMGLLRELGIKPAGPLFGRTFTVNYVSHRFKAAARRAGVQNATLHTLRKTFASHLCLAGVGLHEIQRLLGHSNILITQQYYAELQTSNLHGVVSQLVPVTGSVAVYTKEVPNPFGGIPQ